MHRNLALYLLVRGAGSASVPTFSCSAESAAPAYILANHNHSLAQNPTVSHHPPEQSIDSSNLRNHTHMSGTYFEPAHSE